MKHKYSSYSLYACWLILVLVSTLYYPKWKKQDTEATISWDASGYYFYLPAVFIYHDLKEIKFADDIIKKYRPTESIDQAFKHESGNYVMKYSSGQALVYLPFFGLAHLSANLFGYPPDGFSLPYQFFMSMGSLCIAFIGLYFLRRVLLEYFSDMVVSVVLILVALGTNYTNYAAIDGAMTHNSLFTIYCVLLYLTILFYKHPINYKAITIGALVGLAALIRPTEIISLLIPLFWNFRFPIKKGFSDKFNFIKSHWLKFGIAALACLLVGSIQLIYWKYVSGHWLVYSYRDQGFSWLHPHLYPGIFSYKSGWLVYTPMMTFALVGFVFLYQYSKPIFTACVLFSALFIYITFAWDIWWYGGSLGQRAMVQSYAVLSFPLAAFVQFVGRRLLFYIVYPVFAFCIAYNFWVTYQAHTGGLYLTEQMTKAFYWRVVGRFNVDESAFKLLDTNEEYKGTLVEPKVVLENNFENDTTINADSTSPIEGKVSLLLDADKQWTPEYVVDLKNTKADWVRADATFKCDSKEWNVWSMAQFIVKFYNKENVVIKINAIRVFRFLNDGQTKDLYLDVKIPKEPFEKVGVSVWNADSKKTLWVDNLKVTTFKE